MADEFQSGICGGNWWDSSRNRFDSGSSSTSSTLNTIGSFGWPADMVDIKARSPMDTVSETGSSMVFQDTQKLQGHDSAGAADLTQNNLQMMGLGLSSQAMDWNQTLLRSGKADQSSFRSMLQEDLSSNPNFQQETGMVSSQVTWRSPKMFSSGSCEDSSVNEYKQINRGFSLDQPQFSSHSSSAAGGGGGGESVVTCQGLSSSFQMDYGNPSSTMLQGFLGSNHQPQQQPPMDYPYAAAAANYGMNMNSNELLPSSMSKFPQFLRTSPPKQPPHNQLQLSNNAPFWNASAATMTDIRSGFFPSMQAQFSTPSFDEKPKPNTSEIRDSAGSVAKKSSSEVSMKRPRNETPSPLPAFKVRKEKMGDRITALQQLVSPFGKTDTASVLSEAIEYIKFLHQQVNVLSTPYIKSGAPMQHQQNSDKSKDPEGPKQDLRSRGLCLVPVSSTFPVTHETHIDFYTPTFGGSFR